MTIRLTVLLGLLLLGAACVGSNVPTVSSRSFADDEFDAIEATFRHLFIHNYSALQNKAKAYCLLIKGEMPDRAFLARFSDLPMPLRARTLFRPGADLIFQVTTIRKIDSSLFRIEAGYYEGPVSGSSSIFDVRLKDGRWHVSKNPDGIELISGTDTFSFEPRQFCQFPSSANKAPEPTTTAVTPRAS